MDFRIADTFTDSLARSAADEQKAVKTTAFDLQLNHTNPGMSFHRLNQAKDKNFWSVRVSDDIRLIVHKSKTSLLLFRVDIASSFFWQGRNQGRVGKWQSPPPPFVIITCGQPCAIIGLIDHTST